ncbi:tail fiber protein [Paenibacillus amylolyticus]|nr:tail fiber protein [Paenibacillus amylolyticus]WFR64214.1 tail fiber protein [Paenibacillus amylolyticus]
MIQKGIVQLSSATESDEEGEAATPKAVNTVRQLAVSQIGDLAELKTTDKGNLVDALNEVFQSGSEFKGDVADAITAKGVPTSASDSKETFAQNIEAIETSTVINGQQQVTRTYAETIAANDPVLTKTTYTNDLNFAENLTAANYLTLSPDGVYLAITIGTSPFITIFKRNGSTFAKLPDPAILPTGTAQALAFSSDGVYLAVPHNTSPFITIYKRTGDIFTKLPNPSVLPADFGQIALFSPDGTYLVVGNANTGPYLNIYKRTGDTFVKLSNPSILPSSGVLGLAFSSDGTYLYVGGSGTPYIIVYKRSGDTFTKINDSALALPSTGRAGAFSPDDAYLAIALTGSPTVYIYKRNGDIFTKLPDLGTLPLGNGVGISFSPTNGEHLIVAHSALPYISVFKRSGDKFIQTDAFDVAPIGAPSSIAFDADGKTLAAEGGVSPYARVYTVQKDRVYKSSNNLTDALSNNSIGYALESGIAGETKDIMTIWRS